MKRFLTNANTTPTEPPDVVTWDELSKANAEDTDTLEEVAALEVGEVAYFGGAGCNYVKRID